MNNTQEVNAEDLLSIATGAEDATRKVEGFGSALAAPKQPAPKNKAPLTPAYPEGR
jgi:hypothetical protein